MAPQDLSNRILGLLQATSLDFTIIRNFDENSPAATVCKGGRTNGDLFPGVSALTLTATVG